MANKSVFASIVGKLLPAADAKNREGVPAYAHTPRHKLAQLAATGTFNATFYAEAREQLDEILKLLPEVDAEFIARTAVYARERGFMKDMPALLLAYLSMLQTEHFQLVFPRVAGNGKMLRNVVQVLRSGVTGRKSLGTRPKRLVQAWLETASDIEIMRASVGNDPSLADVIKMVHPRPQDASREALYGWLIGKPHDVSKLPEIVQAFEAFKRDPSAPLPDVPFQMLTSLPLTKAHWVQIAEKAGWHMLRMNLNTFARHGVFEVEGFAEMLAARLRDEGAIRKAKAFPYQLMAAYAMSGEGVPAVVRNALQDAMEIALGNVPEFHGSVVVCPDVSGSMSSPVTGRRKGATSAVRCIDVAALVAAAVLRKNRSARVIPFEQDVVKLDLNPLDSVMTNAAKLAAIGGGGTNCSAPAEMLVREKAKVDLLIYVSDNESWVDASRYTHSGTGLMKAWERLKQWNPDAKLVCIDIQPYGTTQAQEREREDVLNVGGFSDAVFDQIALFAEGRMGSDHWVGEIEKFAL
jgi:60 kDa SS-A/Ro ribonucleoprotein